MESFGFIVPAGGDGWRQSRHCDPFAARVPDHSGSVDFHSFTGSSSAVVFIPFFLPDTSKF